MRNSVHRNSLRIFSFFSYLFFLQAHMFYKINTEYEKYSTIDSVKQIIEDLSAQKNEITVLDLSMNTFVPDVFREITKIIKEMKSLKKVRLESILDSLTYEEMCEILTDLSDSLPRNLDSFELPSNAVSCKFPESFGKFLEECPLKELNLHNCGLGEDGLKKITSHLNKLENKENLVSLDLSKNRINVICTEFIDLFNEFKNLTRFILNANTIEEESMASFLKNITNENLQIVNLTDNFVCGDAIESLGKVFLNNNIKELYLQDIKTNEGDINRLLKMFNEKNNDNLPGTFEDSKQNLILDISCNGFDQECVDLLEDLASIYRLKELIIFDNDYDDIENLKKIIQEDNGFVKDEEEEDIEPMDEEIVEKVKNFGHNKL